MKWSKENNLSIILPFPPSYFCLERGCPTLTQHCSRQNALIIKQVCGRVTAVTSHSFPRQLMVMTIIISYSVIIFIFLSELSNLIKCVFSGQRCFCAWLVIIFWLCDDAWSHWLKYRPFWVSRCWILKNVVLEHT